MKFIIGIGNPGKTYENTRHNIGFAVAETLVDVGWKKESGLKALVAPIGREVSVVKPLSFVNLTGDVALAIKKKHDTGLKDILVVCDDVNLAFGKMRLRASGSAGGHHGLESMIRSLDSNEFARLRIGVKNDAMPKDLTDFVLGRFSSEEKKEIKKILDKAVLICEDWAKQNFEAAQRRLSKLQSLMP